MLNLKVFQLKVFLNEGKIQNSLIQTYIKENIASSCGYKVL